MLVRGKKHSDQSWIGKRAWKDKFCKILDYCMVHRYFKARTGTPLKAEKFSSRILRNQERRTIIAPRVPVPEPARTGISTRVPMVPQAADSTWKVV